MNLKGWPPPIGAKLREDYGHANGFLKKLWHVRAHVDNVIVLRRWSKSCGGRWVYDVKRQEWWHVMMTSKAEPLTVELPKVA